MNPPEGVLDNIKKNINTIIPYDSDKKSALNDFLASNTMISRLTFLLAIVIIFSSLFYIGSRTLYYFLAPSETPYIIKGMKDAKDAITIPQAPGSKKAVPLLRSLDQYEGIEFTYSFWIYVSDVDTKNGVDFMHVFNKGSSPNSKGEDGGGEGLFGPNNCPGVYLYKGKGHAGLTSQRIIDSYPLLGMLVRINVYHNSTNVSAAYYDDIYVDAIPIKKWVAVVIRSTSQNIVDIYINGSLAKRHKLSNIVKQNYDNLYINYNGGFNGNLSNLKYYNYAIGTFEINSIANKGPDLTMQKDSNINKSKSHYLASQWYFTNTDVLT
jgi:hypothetical protein